MSIHPPMSERELRNAALAREAAAQSMVLLRNEHHALPLDPNKPVALFGNGAVRTVRGGTGSGDPFNGGLSGGGEVHVNQSPRYHINILDAFEAASIPVPTASLLREIAVGYDAALTEAGSNPMTVFAYPEQPLNAGQLPDCDVAVYVLSRNAGEGTDRAMTGSATIHGAEYEIGDYQMSAVEKANLALLREHYAQLVIVLNVGGPIDANELLSVQPDAILLMNQAGQEGGRAVLDVLCGAVNPSGKLSTSWTRQYRDNPASATFANNDGNVQVERYTEGIYVGYRYFDRFGIEPAFPFGFGLSYTRFSIGQTTAQLEGDMLSLHTSVTNTGATAGREVLQVYVSAPETELPMPVQELKGYAKTSLLAPEASETLEIRIPLRRLASFDAQREAWILSKGCYRVCLGNSSRNTAPVCRLQVSQTQLLELVYTELPLSEPLDELHPTAVAPALCEADWEGVPELTVSTTLETMDRRSRYHAQRVTTYTTDPNYQARLPYEDVQLVPAVHARLADVLTGKVPMEQFVAQLSAEQMSRINCGTGWGVADEHNPVVGGSSESVPGAAGETPRDYEEMFGIPSMVVADGPGGIRVAQTFTATDLNSGEKVERHHFCTAWPTGTLLAQSFDSALLERVGAGFAEELAELHIAIVLGPGMNIHRDPLCGRNFEYFSEDPLLAGDCAAAITRGIQSLPGTGACIKHFAANNQESNRNAVDTIVGQRALREIYLKPFEIAVKTAQPMSIMTSYNLINGVPTADSFDLCTDLARGEWDFQGLIMTDWNGGSSTPWKSMHAGNDLIMPGGPSRSSNILQAVETVLPRFDERGQVEFVEMMPGFPLRSPAWCSFSPDAEGPDSVSASIAEGHTATVENGEIRVDGEPIYTAAGDFRLLFADRSKFKPYTAALTTSMATLSEDGRTIVYRGYLDRTPRLCLGDLQRCTMHNLHVIMHSIAMLRTDPTLPLHLYPSC